MDQTNMFLLGVAATLAGSAAVIGILREHLRRLLTELCGTPERADFWATFSHILLVLVPLSITLLYRPRPDIAMVFQVSNHLAVSVLGLAATLAAMGVIVATFIPGFARGSAAK